MIIFAGIAFAAAVLATIVALLLRRQLREKYAVLWLTIGLALLLISVFPEVLLATTRLLGVQVPSNLIFALAIVLLVGVALHLSWELSRAEDEVRRLAEHVAILRADFESLQDSVVAEISRQARGEVDPPQESPTSDSKRAP